MADIELVIKIPEEEYQEYIKMRPAYPDGVFCLIKEIQNGTPLPKGHGRLGDLDALEEEVSSWGMNDYEPLDFIDAIDEADTIIEADKEYEVEIVTRGNCMMCGKELDEGLFFCKECEAKIESGKKE